MAKDTFDENAMNGFVDLMREAYDIAHRIAGYANNNQIDVDVVTDDALRTISHTISQFATTQAKLIAARERHQLEEDIKAKLTALES